MYKSLGTSRNLIRIGNLRNQRFLSALRRKQIRLISPAISRTQKFHRVLHDLDFGKVWAFVLAIQLQISWFVIHIYERVFALMYCLFCWCTQYIHVVCAILLSSFSTYANANDGQRRKGRRTAAAAASEKKGAQKLKVIKNANLMLLLPDSLTLCALTVVSRRSVSCRVLSCLLCLGFFFCLCFRPSNCCRHHSLLPLSLRAAFIFGTQQEMIYANWPTRN